MTFEWECVSWLTEKLTFPLIFFGSSASWVGEKSLKASFYEPGLHLEYVWVDTEPLADVMCQPYVQPTPVNGLAGRMTGYHIALSM